MKDNYWTNYKKYQLYLLYSAGTTLFVIGDYFSISQSALNKCLARFNIRKAGKNPKLCAKWRAITRTLAGAEKLIAVFQLDYDTVERQHLKQNLIVDPTTFKPTGISAYRMQMYGLNIDGVWPPALRRITKLQTMIYSDKEILEARYDSKIAKLTGNLLKQFFQEERRDSKLIINAPFSRVINYLRTKGSIVEFINRKMFKIDDKILNDGQVLILANKNRLLDKLPIFQVESITKS